MQCLINTNPQVISNIHYKQLSSSEFILLGFNRPKRLLVFINPVGGRKLGRKIYTEQVQPLFELANIKVDIIGE